MHEDNEIEHSPLERDVTHNGVTVCVLIYRGHADAGWLLEVRDPDGGSTVWEDAFETDRAAFDEAMDAINTDGIESFTKQR